jgi:hypothetical protein
MSKPADWKEIEKQLKSLSIRDQKRLAARLAPRLRHTGNGSHVDWAKLYGLGKGLWKRVDAQVYVNRLRGDRV